MYVWMDVRIFMCINIYKHIDTSELDSLRDIGDKVSTLNMGMFIYFKTYLYMYEYMYGCIYVWIYVYLCVSIYTNIWYF
jgi:hypothetical protein